MAGLAEIQAALAAQSTGLNALAVSVSNIGPTLGRLANDRLASADGDAIVASIDGSTNTIASLQAQLDAANASAPA